MKCSIPQWYPLNQQGMQAHNAAHTLRPQAALRRVSKPSYLVCKSSLPFFQCKPNTIHNYSAKPLTPTDTASCLAESRLPKDNLRGSGTPQSLALGVLELKEGSWDWLNHGALVETTFQEQRLFQGRIKPQKPSVPTPCCWVGDPHLASEAFSYHAPLCPRE